MIIDGQQISKFFDFEIEVVFDDLRKGKYNMEFDWQRTIALENKNAIPMLRFYGWKPWAISLGANQSKNDFDEKLCREHGIDIVRRPTGGRAVLHARELTYSFVIPIKQNYNPKDAYREIHFFLLSGLKLLGVDDLYFQKAQLNLNEFYKRELASVSCFASSARYEIEWEGKKIVGSAQRLYGDTLLQHGSILLWKGYEQIAELVNFANESNREYLRKYIQEHSISIGEILGREVSFDEAQKSYRILLGM
ncbi:MAG: lipoate--protein ligase family protein [Candidatus Kapaibacteriales bacterium]